MDVESTSVVMTLVKARARNWELIYRGKTPSEEYSVDLGDMHGRETKNTEIKVFVYCAATDCPPKVIIQIDPYPISSEILSVSSVVAPVYQTNVSIITLNPIRDTPTL